MGAHGVTFLIISTSFCKWELKWIPRATLGVKVASSDHPDGMSTFAGAGCTLYSKPLSSEGQRRTSFFTFPKMERAIPGPLSTVWPEKQFSPDTCVGRLGILLSKPHPKLLPIPTILGIKRPLPAFAACQSNYKRLRYPTEDLHCLASHPFSLLTSSLHIVFRKQPWSRLNGWPQLSAPPCIHVLCCVTVCSSCCRQEMLPSLTGRGLAWLWDLLWPVHVSEGGHGVVWAQGQEVAVYTYLVSITPTSLPQVRNLKGVGCPRSPLLSVVSQEHFFH